MPRLSGIDQSRAAPHLPAMNDILTITRCPRPFDPDKGAEVRALFPEVDSRMAELLEGTGGSSPYLAGLMAKEVDWLRGALEAPRAALSAEGARLQGLDPLDPSLGSELRRGKRRMALIVALADLSGAWRLEEVTGALTDFGDLSAGVALRAGLASELKRKKLPEMTEADLDTGCGITLLAMGKMGAGELNYSSDIDLIALYDEDRFQDHREARPALIRAVRKMSSLLSEITGEGYVFRTDLRLRPDPSVTPVCVGMEAAENYYESVGRTWERAAYIKARACAGDVDRGEQFIATLRPFVWRRHLDYAAIQDAHAVRLAIRDSKGYHGPLCLSGHDMKLGRGGIREIEFFAQFHQLIAGGRDPSLRIRATVPALDRLAVTGWLPSDLATELADHYSAHREVEHRVQMINDAQTHKLPGNGEGLARIAALMGRDEAELRADLSRRLEAVHEATEAFFAPDPAATVPPTDGPEDEEEGFDDAVLDRWHHYPALASTRAREIFSRLRPQLLAGLRRAAKPDEALQAFDGFLKGLPAGVQLFSLFEANPQLVDLICDIAGTVPDLALYLSRNSGVFDAVIGGGFFEPWPGVQALSAELAEVLAHEADYETRLDAARRWAKEWHFRIGVHHLRGLIAPEEAGAEYAGLAEAVLQGVWPVVQEEFARRHGPAPGRGAVVMGMGSLGAGRLNARSDLDLIVIYDADGQDSSEGRRPLPARVYYSRLTQALVTALSAPMAQGRLYEVDMRLRPSGNQGARGDLLAGLPQLPDRKRLDLGTPGPDAGAGDRGARGAGGGCHGLLRRDRVAGTRQGGGSARGGRDAPAHSGGQGGRRPLGGEGRLGPQPGDRADGTGRRADRGGPRGLDCRRASAGGWQRLDAGGGAGASVRHLPPVVEHRPGGQVAQRSSPRPRDDRRRRAGSSAARYLRREHGGPGCTVRGGHATGGGDDLPGAGARGRAAAGAGGGE